MDLNLGLDIINRKLLNPLDGSALTLSPLVQGDTLNLLLHGMEANSAGGYNFVPIDYDTIQFGIGLIDEPPTGGTFPVQIGASVAANIPFNVTPRGLARTLNALASVTALGGLTVWSGGAPNLWIAQWNDPTVTTPITIPSLELFPYCFSRVITVPLDTQGTAFLIKLFQAPVSFTDQFELPASPAVTCAEVQAGAGTLSEVWKLIVPTGALGEFTLTLGSLTTLVIPVSSVSTATLASALNNLWSDSVTRFQVIQPGDNYYYIQLVGPLAQTQMDAPVVTMLSQPPAITPTASLSLNVPGIEIALAGGKSVGMTLQIEIIKAGQRGTPLQIPVTINASLLDSGMALAVDPPWLNPRSVTLSNGGTANSPSLVGMIGAQQPEVGDGYATEFTFTHNLNGTRVLVAVIDNNTDIRLPDDQYICKIQDSNNVVVTFPTPPTLNQYTIVVATMYATPYYQNLNLQISDIGGLQTALSNLSNAGTTNPLEFWPTIPVAKLPQIPITQITGNFAATVLPSNLCYLDSNNWVPLANINPAIPRVASDGSVVYSTNATSNNPTYQTLITKEGNISNTLITQLASSPSFTQAVQSVLAGTAAPPQSGTVIPFSAKSEVIGFPSSLTLPTPNAQGAYPNDKFLHVAPSLLWSDSNLQASYNRELWRLPLNDKLWADGSSVQIDWGVALQVLRPNCGVQYQLVAELGTYTSDSSYLSVTWNTTEPIFTQNILLTEELVIHSFALTLTRALVSGTDTFTLAQTLYGAKTVNSNPPSTANSVLRSRLINLETENTSVQADPRGWISWGLVASTTAASNVIQPQALIATL